MRKTKIICTLGPATDDENVLKELIKCGMDVARFNFSHSTQEDHLITLNKIKKFRDEFKKPIATLLDTRGPEIRLGVFKEGSVDLVEGQSFTLTTEDIEGDSSRVSITYKNLINDIEIGSTILIDDGLVEMKVIEKTTTDISCKVINDGTLSDRKGVNVPGVFLSMPYISKKDREDIIFGIKNGFDFIAASFVRNAKDILEIRKILDEHNCKTINIVAKIENIQGVDNIDEIIKVADCIMIARGDMGVEMPYEDLPAIQKMIIKKVSNSGKVVITATQMLDSMMKHPRPTRAEATDVANAIYDGTGAIMLSGETAAGHYPVESLKTMVRIAIRTEEDIDYLKRFSYIENAESPDITTAISRATCNVAHTLNASAIITVTTSGRTAKKVSRFRPNCPIIACTTDSNVARQLNLSWGVLPLFLAIERDTFELFDHAVHLVEQKGYIKTGDITVLTAGLPLGTSGTTNMIKVQVAGEKH
ncbi:MAG TPA: pyruvate kinase [Clostridiales bacterium]|nr:pyruvate kinase [Clostridiales bacterium]